MSNIQKYRGIDLPKFNVPTMGACVHTSRAIRVMGYTGNSGSVAGLDSPLVQVIPTASGSSRLVTPIRQVANLGLELSRKCRQHNRARFVRTVAIDLQNILSGRLTPHQDTIQEAWGKHTRLRVDNERILLEVLYPNGADQDRLSVDDALHRWKDYSGPGSYHPEALRIAVQRLLRELGKRALTVLEVPAMRDRLDAMRKERDKANAYLESAQAMTRRVVARHKREATMLMNTAKHQGEAILAHREERDALQLEVESLHKEADVQARVVADLKVRLVMARMDGAADVQEARAMLAPTTDLLLRVGQREAQTKLEVKRMRQERDAATASLDDMRDLAETWRSVAEADTDPAQYLAESCAVMEESIDIIADKLAKAEEDARRLGEERAATECPDPHCARAWDLPEETIVQTDAPPAVLDIPPARVEVLPPEDTRTCPSLEVKILVGVDIEVNLVK